MNYDKIILELLSRVQTLEEEIQKLKYEHNQTEEKEADENALTRSEARDVAIKELETRFPDYFIQKASRKDGSGIFIRLFNNKKEPIRIKFYHSKVHERGTGWHVVRLDEVMDLSYCMFSMIDGNGDWHFFIYGTDEIGEYRDTHRSDKNNDILHLYFAVKDGNAFETREGCIDVTDHLDNWDILNENNICS